MSNTTKTLNMNYNDPIDLQEIAEKWELNFRCDCRNGRVLIYRCEGDTLYGRTATICFWAADSEIEDPEAWARVLREGLYNVDIYNPENADEDATPEEITEDFEKFVELVGGETYNYDEGYDEYDKVMEDLTDFLARVDYMASDFEAKFGVAA